MGWRIWIGVKSSYKNNLVKSWPLQRVIKSSETKSTYWPKTKLNDANFGSVLWFAQKLLIGLVVQWQEVASSNNIVVCIMKAWNSLNTVFVWPYWEDLIYYNLLALSSPFSGVDNYQHLTACSGYIRPNR